MFSTPSFVAAFSTYERNLSHLKAFGRPETSFPSFIILESLLALFLGIISVCLKSPALKEITWTSEMKTSGAQNTQSCFALPGGFCWVSCRHLVVRGVWVQDDRRHGMRGRGSRIS
ncbi:hypothetical protein BJY52DRAFT_1296696 [Lactarius psammicola]|nr:hypothetical protein BJY52DRAFT_1296696 [Lactarius psammicola]